MLNSIFDQMDFGPLQEFLDDDDVTDVSYSNGGQIWLKTLSKGIYQVERPNINNAFMEKLAFQCSNVMGKTFNMAHPFLDAEAAELRMNFVHDSIATNGIAVLMRKTPATIRLNKEKLIDEDYVTEQVHEFLVQCVHARCNIIVAGETGSGKTELVKYLASNTKEDEKIISIEDTLELHLDKIYPTRDIVAMKTNNIASYTEALVACMRQNPIWILLSEVRSGEAVLAVRNSISSGHHILSTIHADKASSIPMRMYSLLESSQDIDQFVTSIHRYVQIGIYVKGYFSKRLNRFQREILEVCEFYVDDETQKPIANEIYRKQMDGRIILRNPTEHLRSYMAIGNVDIPKDYFGLGEQEEKIDDSKKVDLEALEKEEEEKEKQKPQGIVTSKEDPFGMNNSSSEQIDEIESLDDSLEENVSTTSIENETSLSNTTEEINHASAAVNDNNIVQNIQESNMNNIALSTPTIQNEPTPVEAKPVLENLPKPVVNGFMQSPPQDAVIA